MKIAILSGKGGAGKTLVATNLAGVAERATYVDCDVEEPNGRLLLQPQNVHTSNVTVTIPVFDKDSCTGCRACVKFCRFNALFFIKDQPKLIAEVCHSCGGCKLVCPSGAVTEVQRPVGILEVGTFQNIRVITGVLNIGEASGVPVIRQAMKTAEDEPDLTIVDCPPGSACTVMECVQHADICLLVAEPTAFGLHNLRMVHQLATLSNKPRAIVVNKQQEPYQPLEDFCLENNLPILLRIPFNKTIAQLSANGQLASLHDATARDMFTNLLDTLKGMTP